MDPTLLVKFLAPFLSQLLNIGKTPTQTTTETVASKFGEAAWVKAQTIWSQLRPKLEVKAAAQEALTDLAQSPEDPDFQTVLQVQLKKLFAQDKVLAAEISNIIAADPVLPSDPAISQHVVGKQHPVTGQTFSAAVGTVEQRPRKRTIILSREVGNVDLDTIKAAVEGVHVVPDEGGWEVRKSGQARIQTHFDSKHEAEKYAQELGEREQVKVFIHSKEGLLRAKSRI